MTDQKRNADKPVIRRTENKSHQQTDKKILRVSVLLGTACQ
jgi:hypothetical protein